MMYENLITSSSQSGEIVAQACLPDTVAEEIKHLADSGYDVTTSRVSDRHALGPARQALVDKEIARLEGLGDFIPELFHPVERPSGYRWLKMAKRAAALQTLYRAGDGATLGEGIDPRAYDDPIFEGKTAREVIRATKSPDKADKILEIYDDFVGFPIEPDPIYGLGSRDFFRGVRDAIAVRKRADVALSMAEDHLLTRGNPKEGLVSASLACGAAEPVYQLEGRLRKLGTGLKKIILVDHDVMALASANSLAHTYGLEQKIVLHNQDLIRDKLTNYIPKHSVDVVDLLGLFEYIPEQIKLGGVVKYRPAEALLSSVKEIVKPGGLIILGNMLVDRPQQEFFKKVWPPLYKRTIQQTLDIISNSGYDAGRTTIRVPDDGIYAVYGVRVPEVGGKKVHQPGRSQRVARWMIQHR